MTEVMNDATRILENLKFDPRCERRWANETEQCQTPATLMVTFRNYNERVVNRLSCDSCCEVLEDQHRVYKTVRL